MAYTVTGGSILEFTIRSLVANQVCLSIFHYKYVGTSDIPNAGNVASSFLNQMQTGTPSFLSTYLAACSEDLGVTQLVTQWIFPLRWARYVDNSPTVGQGTVAQPCQAQNVSIAITKRTDLAGRIGNGTLHMPGVPVTFYASGERTVASNAPYNAVADNLNEVVTVGSYEFAPIVYRRSAAAQSPIITGAEVENELRTMRRRTLLRGI